MFISNEENVSNQQPIITLFMKIDGRFAYRVYDEFDEESIVENIDGSFNVTFSVPEDKWIYAYILSYGTGAVVIEPQRIRKKITQKLNGILDKYS